MPSHGMCDVYEMAEAAQTLAAGEGDSWFADDDRVDQVSQIPAGKVRVIQTAEFFKQSYIDAADMIRRYKPEGGRPWTSARGTKPLLYVAPQLRYWPEVLRLQPTVNRVHRRMAMTILESILNSFFYEIYLCIEPTWHFWVNCFFRLQIEEKLRVLESMPALRAMPPLRNIDPHPAPLRPRACIIAGLDIVDSPDTRPYIKRFVQAVEKLLINHMDWRVLFYCRDPFPLAEMMRDPSRVEDPRIDTDVEPRMNVEPSNGKGPVQP